jgi:hypothetical protein
VFNWYLVYSKPRQELCSLENLERQGFECFLPLIAVETDSLFNRMKPSIAPQTVLKKRVSPETTI